MNCKQLVYRMLILALIVSCEEQVSTTSFIKALPATDLTQHSFVAHWEPLTTVNGYVLEFASDKQFATILETFQLDGASQSEKIISGLESCATYFYRVKAIDSKEYSMTMTVTTLPISEDVFVVTEEGLKVSVTVARKAELNGSLPAILFIHRFYSSKHNWIKNDFYKLALAEGFLTVAMDIRGHGETGGELAIQESMDSTLSRILPDVKAVVDYMETLPNVDTARIAAVGGSIGAIMAVGAKADPDIHVRTAISLSAHHDGVMNILWNTEKPVFQSIYYLAASQDGDAASSAEQLHVRTLSPKKLTIINGSSDHGEDIFKSESLRLEGIKWLKETMDL